MTYKSSPMQCPECGEPYLPVNGRDVPPPEDSEETPLEDRWLADKAMSALWREWTCEECATVTKTIEVRVDFLHDITADSPEKSENINENFAPKGVTWIQPPRGYAAQQVIASPDLAVIVGSAPQYRGDIVRKIWSYITESGLQDATDKRMINPDGALTPIFGRDSFSMFEMSDVVEGHLRTVASI